MHSRQGRRHVWQKVRQTSNRQVALQREKVAVSGPEIWKVNAPTIWWGLQPPFCRYVSHGSITFVSKSVAAWRSRWHSNTGSLMCKYKYLPFSHGQVKHASGLLLKISRLIRDPLIMIFNFKPSGGKGKVLDQESGILGLHPDSTVDDPCALLLPSGPQLPRLYHERFILLRPCESVLW